MSVSYLQNPMGADMFSPTTVLTLWIAGAVGLALLLSLPILFGMRKCFCFFCDHDFPKRYLVKFRQTSMRKCQNCFGKGEIVQQADYTDEHGYYTPCRYVIPCPDCKIHFSCVPCIPEIGLRGFCIES